ncbi:MAG: hypothetical protein HY042_02045 [Spirochaetia bacterium]|nr:hypothetical protein [Spirochaetia bacterium]
MSPLMNFQMLTLGKVTAAVIVPVFFWGQGLSAQSRGQNTGDSSRVEIGLCDWSTELPAGFKELQRGSGWLMAEERGRAELIMACLPNNKRTDSAAELEERIRLRGGEVKGAVKHPVPGGLSGLLFEHTRVDRGRKIESVEAYFASKAYEYRIYVILKNLPASRAEREARLGVTRHLLEAMIDAGTVENGQPQAAITESIYRGRLALAVLFIALLGSGAGIYGLLWLRRQRIASRVRAEAQALGDAAEKTANSTQASRSEKSDLS